MAGPGANVAGAEMSLDRLERVVALLEAWAQADDAAGAVLYVARQDRVILERGFGHVLPLDVAHPEPMPAGPETIFLIASLTKPVTAAAVALLVEHGQVALGDPVDLYIPEFRGGERHRVRVRHLLTHTSGLPDMLPENVALRSRHAPLEAFVAGTCATPLLYPPGTDCRYQSKGLLLLGTIVERVTGMSLRDYIAREIYSPLGMADSWLGLGPLPRGRVAQVNIGQEEAQTDWHWNSAYWRDLGAPWGGMHATASDYARFLRLFLNEGQHNALSIMARATVQTMLSNQIAAMPLIPERVKAEQGWGLGWRLNWPRGAEHLPEIGSECIFGHLGATGTMAWADPDSGLICVLFTNQPQVGRLRSLVSNTAATLV